MASADAQLAKDKGNAAFKAQQYVEAIGHYTTAILADKNDVTFPLNRAAAYLKLGKHEDAVRDCTTALKLKPGHVKALFRRAQAQIELRKLQDARQDLEAALKAEPNNDAVKAELAKLKGLSSEQLKGNKAGPSPSDTPAPQRRRVPIRVVETPAESKIISAASGSSSSDGLSPISTRRLTPPNANGSNSATSSNLAVPSARPSHSEPESKKQSSRSTEANGRPEARGAGVGGGIFRPSGSHTIIQSNGSRSLSGAGQSTVPQQAPVTLFTFTKAWETCRSANERWQLFSSIPPSSLPSLFQTSLEADLLNSILELLSAVLQSDDGPNTHNIIREYLNSLSKVPRFSAILLFMSATEKRLAKDLMTKVGDVQGWKL